MQAWRYTFVGYRPKHPNLDPKPEAPKSSSKPFILLPSPKPSMYRNLINQEASGFFMHGSSQGSCYVGRSDNGFSIGFLQYVPRLRPHAVLSVSFRLQAGTCAGPLPGTVKAVLGGHLLVLRKPSLAELQKEAWDISNNTLRKPE